MKVTIMCKNGTKIIDLNRRKSIREKCLNCSGWISNKVTSCTFTDCYLHPYRTGNGKQNPKKRKEAIKKYCLYCQSGQHSEVKKCVSSTCSLFPYRLMRTDRSVEIAPNSEKVHIEAISEDEISPGSHYMSS